jgi:hypothetical protein
MGHKTHEAVKEKVTLQVNLAAREIAKLYAETLTEPMSIPNFESLSAQIIMGHTYGD